MENYLGVTSPPQWNNFDLIDLDYNAMVYPGALMVFDNTIPEDTENFTINWDELGGVKPYDTIGLKFQIDKYSNAVKMLVYRPDQLLDLRHLLGAISYFYQQPITIADAQAALIDFQEKGKNNTLAYHRTFDFANGTGPAPKYHELMGYSHLDTIRFAKPKPGVDPRAAYPEGWAKGEYNILFRSRF